MRSATPRPADLRGPPVPCAPFAPPAAPVRGQAARPSAIRKTLRLIQVLRLITGVPAPQINRRTGKWGRRDWCAARDRTGTGRRAAADQASPPRVDLRDTPWSADTVAGSRPVSWNCDRGTTSSQLAAAIRRWVIGSPPAFEAGSSWFESRRRNCVLFIISSSHPMIRGRLFRPDAGRCCGDR
jgi:hypothetical protein